MRNDAESGGIKANTGMVVVQRLAFFMYLLGLHNMSPPLLAALWCPL
jgi:hypothetical protein